MASAALQINVTPKRMPPNVPPFHCTAWSLAAGNARAHGGRLLR